MLVKRNLISVIVPIHGIERCLLSLVTQDLPTDGYDEGFLDRLDYEVITTLF